MLDLMEIVCVGGWVGSARLDRQLYAHFTEFSLLFISHIFFLFCTRYIVGLIAYCGKILHSLHSGIDSLLWESFALATVGLIAYCGKILHSLHSGNERQLWGKALHLYTIYTYSYTFIHYIHMYMF